MSPLKHLMFMCPAYFHSKVTLLTEITLSGIQWQTFKNGADLKFNYQERQTHPRMCVYSY